VNTEIRAKRVRIALPHNQKVRTKQGNLGLFTSKQKQKTEMYRDRHEHELPSYLAFDKTTKPA